VIVYFAGNGAAEAGTGRALLLPHDADPGVPDSAYAVEVLLAKLAELDARTVTLVLDTSFAGVTRDGRPLREDRDIRPGAIDTSTIPANTLVFLAAGEGESNLPFARQRHGLFTYYFLRGVVDADADGLTADALAEFVGPRVSAEAGQSGLRQSPVLLGRDRSRTLVAR
jgi:hypothetical protein